jgi:hypothetical protein
VRVLFIEHDTERRVKRPKAETGEIVAELLHAPLVADSWMWIRCAGWGFSRILPPLAVDVIELLGLCVIRLQLFVRDRPGRRDAARVAQFSKILFAEPKQGSPEKLRVAADIVVCVRVQLFAGLIPPHFRGLVLALGINSLRTPVVLLSWDVVATFEQENAFARRCQPVGERTAAGSRSNNDNVVVIRRGTLLTIAAARSAER